MKLYGYVRGVAFVGIDDTESYDSVLSDLRSRCHLITRMVIVNSFDEARRCMRELICKV